MRKATNAKRGKEVVKSAQRFDVRRWLAGVSTETRKTITKRARPVEKRAEALTIMVRKFAAGYLRAVGRGLNRLEKAVAPPTAVRARAKRAKTAPVRAAPLQMSRARAAHSEAAA